MSRTTARREDLFRQATHSEWHASGEGNWESLARAVHSAPGVRSEGFIT